MSAQEFAAHFRSSSRIMWLIAIGIVGDTFTAEDCLQDAAMVALKKLGQFQPGTSFRAWLGTIVRNVALNAVRSDRRRRSAVGDWPEFDKPAVHDSDISESLNEFDTSVRTALATIGDVARACLILRTVGDLQYSEIAELLEIPEGTAMSHVHRARIRLRKDLAHIFDERTARSVRKEDQPGRHE